MTNRLIAKPLLFVFCLSLAMPHRVANAGVPTIDIANITQTTITAIKQIQQVAQLYQQIDNQINQIQKQVESFENLNGDYFKHLLLNTDEFKEARRWVPKTYQDVLDLYKNINVDGFEDTVNSGWGAADDLHVTLPDDFYEDVDAPQSKRWSQHKNDNMAGVGLAEQAYKRVDELLEETEDLMDDIEDSIDAKAAQDLANRMAGQTQLVLAELVRLQASQGSTNARNALHQQAIMGEDKKRAGSEIPDIFDPGL